MLRTSIAFAALVIAFATPHTRAVAQHDSARTYVTVHGGPALQQKDEPDDPRHRFGVTAGVTAGRPIRRTLLVEGELSGAWFGVENRESVPLPSGVPSTGAPATGPVDLLMLAANAVYVESPGAPGSIVIAGVGASRFYAHPQHQGAIRPFVQLGVGAHWPWERSSQMAIEVKCQRFTGAYDPRWLVPVTLDLRF